MPFEEALSFLLEKDPNPSEWSAADWAEERPAVRVRSFISSRVESARFLDRAQGMIFDYLTKVREEVTTPEGEKTTALRVGGREDFVMLMRRFMIGEGMARPEEFQSVNQKDLEDIRSVSRLRLIFDTNVRQAYGYGQWKQGMKPAVRRAFPAARLVRVRGVLGPRPRHAAHEGEVRLKTDLDWWAKYQNDPQIGGFGVPWGPYGFHSGMGQEDVSRAEAKRLGLRFDTGGEEMKTTSLPGINDGLQFSVRGMDAGTKQKLLEELRRGPAPASPEDAAREAAANVRRVALLRGLRRAEETGDAAELARIQELLRAEPFRQFPAVREEGEEIKIGEDIGERISKARKRDGMTTPEQEKAIADAVFQRIDRKAAEPKQRAEPARGAARGRQLLAPDLTVTPEERLMIESPHEILLVHTAEGRLKEAVMGDKRTVGIPDKLPADAILSHNHPSGRGPSDSDIKAVLARPGVTLRIVTVNEGRIELFQIRAKEALADYDVAAMADFYRDEALAQGDSSEARRSALRLLETAFGDIIEVATRIW